MADTDDLSAYEFDNTGEDYFANTSDFTGQSYTTGKIGQAVAAEGALIATDSPEFAYLASGGTVGMWVNVTTGMIELGGTVLRFGVYTGAVSLDFSLDSDGTNIVMNLQGSTPKTSSILLATGWHWFTWTRTGNTTQFYVDNATLGSATSVVPATNTDPAASTVQWTDNFGELDQLLVSPNVFSSDFRARIYNSGAGRPASEFAAGGGAGADQRRQRILLLEGQSA